MSCVHYKFSSRLSSDVVTFHGPHISLRDLRRQIMGRERLKATHCDLQVTSAQTMEGAWGWRARDAGTGRLAVAQVASEAVGPRPAAVTCAGASELLFRGCALAAGVRAVCAARHSSVRGPCATPRVEEVWFLGTLLGKTRRECGTMPCHHNPARFL